MMEILMRPSSIRSAVRKGAFLGLTAAALALMGSAASADILALGNPNPGITPLGNTNTFNLDGTNVVASGFNASGLPTALDYKNNTGDEIGLGLANDSTGDGEIEYNHGFVQLDLSALRAAGFTGFGFTTDSTTALEQWAVYGTNTAGNAGCGYTASGCTLATLIASAQSEEQGSAIALTGTFNYYDFIEVGNTTNSGCTWGYTSCSDTNDNFLIDTLSATPRVGTPVPEPITLSVFGLGLAGAVGLRRRKKAGSV
jgi:hypothetical protein